MGENIIIQYKGFLDYGLLNKLLMDFINYVEKNDIDSYYLKKIQIVMVEMLENNYQYTQLVENELKAGILPEIKIIELGHGYKVLSSNPILKKDVSKLRNKIEKINSLEMEEIKDLYKKTLQEGMHIKKNNAGTGLIRIAKVAKNKIGYSFNEINNKLLYYTLEILVNPK